MSGMHIEMINPPNVVTDALVRKADLFWKQHFEGAGATIEIRSNL